MPTTARAHADGRRLAGKALYEALSVAHTAGGRSLHGKEEAVGSSPTEGFTGPAKASSSVAWLGAFDLFFNREGSEPLGGRRRRRRLGPGGADVVSAPLSPPATGRS